MREALRGKETLSLCAFPRFFLTQSDEAILFVSFCFLGFGNARTGWIVQFAGTSSTNATQDQDADLGLEEFEIGGPSTDCKGATFWPGRLGPGRP